MTEGTKVITPDGKGEAFIVGSEQVAVKFENCYAVYKIDEIREDENGYKQQSLFGK